jgi:hypothetical protein
MKQKMLTKKQFDRLDSISLHLLLSGLLICPFSFYFIELSKWIVIFLLIFGILEIIVSFIIMKNKAYNRYRNKHWHNWYRAERGE